MRNFGQVVEKYGLEKPADINRATIVACLDNNQQLHHRTYCGYLSSLRSFLNWLELPSEQLIRIRDFPKGEKSSPDWLDTSVRTSIRQYLDKIPAPIARQYLLQDYTATRPADICQMPFDCLEEEEGNWFICFYQHKVARQHRLPANREIRATVEKQQQWICEVLGQDYPYLFCHFRGLQKRQYPSFSIIRPLREPSRINTNENIVVRVVQLMIEQEDIRDLNGQRPRFTGKITRASRLQEIRVKHGLEAAQLYADHTDSSVTLQHYAPATREQVAKVDLPFQEILMNSNKRFLPWQSLPESLLRNPKAHELDLEISPRLLVYGYCSLDPKTPCPYSLYPKCYGCSSFRPSTSKLPMYERQYVGEKQRMEEVEAARAELIYEEARATLEAMDNWLPELRRLADA